MGEQRVQDKYKSHFDAYRQLQSESYEFITRNVAIHNWLREAYRVLCEKPGLCSGETHETWGAAFERIYGHLFAAFLRPYNVMMFPFGEPLRTQAESVVPGTLANIYLQTLKLWADGQSGFLGGMAGSFQQSGEKNEKLTPGNGHSSIDGVQELTPLRLIENIADSEAKVCYQMLEQTLYCFKESHFSLPKTLVLHLQKLVSSYPEAYRLAVRYEAMFRSTWEKSLEKFTSEISKGSEPISEFKEFYNTYSRIFSQEYGQLLASPEFINLQNGFIAANLDVIASMRKVMEAQLQMFPSLPFVTGGEMAALEKTVHGHKRRLDMLERKVREMERKSTATPQNAGLKKLKRNGNGHLKSSGLFEVVK